MSVRLTVQLQIQKGKNDDFEAACAAGIAAVKKTDKGCEMYDLYRSLDDDTRYVMVESWASAEDLAAHGKSPAMAEMAAMGGFLAGAPTMHQYED
jgi:quinol monooxygenase YgiN